MATERLRLDRMLVARGLAPSRAKAQGMILAGEVRVDGRAATKPGFAVKESSRIEVVARRPPRVGRGGAKLEGALDRLEISVGGRSAMDIGASVGGFTECLLRRGARSVIAVDVGRGQLDWSLRQDPRVHPLEGVNARYMRREDLPGDAPLPDLVVIDVSFISLDRILPAVARTIERGEVIALVKPQFEAGPENVGPGGIVRDPVIWERTVRSVVSSAVGAGFAAVAVAVSPLTGAEGNVEFFVHLRRCAAEGKVLDGLGESLRTALSEAAALSREEP